MTFMNGDHQNIDPEAQNKASVLRFGFMLGLAILIASAAHPAMVPAVLSTLLFMGSVVFSLIGLVGGARLRESHFTQLDVGLWLLTASFLAAAFVDHSAVRDFMLQIQTQTQTQTPLMHP